MTLEEAADIIFFEAEASEGFLGHLHSRSFNAEHWQQLWQAVAEMAAYTNGTFDLWTAYDLNRVIAAVQARGQELVGRSYNELDEFERQVISANMFLNEVLADL